jgi:hypothetical protein
MKRKKFTRPPKAPSEVQEEFEAALLEKAEMSREQEDALLEVEARYHELEQADYEGTLNPAD